MVNALWNRALMAAFAALSVGCGRSVPQIQGPVILDAVEYDRAFDASIEVLRDLKFVVDRKDRRFGVVTTHPQVASSVFEPWRADNTTSEQVAENTLNLQRRTVRVHLDQARQPQVPTNAYALSVEVSMDRRRLPPRNLTSSAIGAVTLRRVDTRYRPIATETGVQTAEWSPAGRDSELEGRIIAMILDQAAAMPPTAPSEDRPHEPQSTASP